MNAVSPSHIDTEQELAKYLNGTGYTEKQFITESHDSYTMQKHNKPVKPQKPNALPFNVMESVVI